MKYPISCGRLQGLVNAWHCEADKGEGGAFRQCARDLKEVIVKAKKEASKKKTK